MLTSKTRNQFSDNTDRAEGKLESVYRVKPAVVATTSVICALAGQLAESSVDLALSIDLLRNTGIIATFAESTINRSPNETDAQSAGVILPEQPLYVEGPSSWGTPAETYQDCWL